MLFFFIFEFWTCVFGVLVRVLAIVEGDVVHSRFCRYPDGLPGMIKHHWHHIIVKCSDIMLLEGVWYS